jgi:hypothetical protein
LHLGSESRGGGSRELNAQGISLDEGRDKRGPKGSLTEETALKPEIIAWGRDTMFKIESRTGSVNIEKLIRNEMY